MEGQTGNGTKWAALDAAYTSVARSRLRAELKDTEVHIKSFDDPDETYHLNCYTHQMYLNESRLQAGDFVEVFDRALTQLERSCDRLLPEREFGVDLRVIVKARSAQDAVSQVRGLVSDPLTSAGFYCDWEVMAL